jgi:biopolymer transport protein ExbD
MPAGLLPHAVSFPTHQFPASTNDFMAIRRNFRLLIEPPASATGDIAFNLIVFFLVCASVQPDSGRKQTIPKAEQTEQKEQQTDTISVELTRQAVFLDGDPVTPKDFFPRIKAKLDARSNPAEKVVVVKSKPDTPYNHWIAVTSQIEDAGGIVTLQLEEEQTVTVP